MPEKSGVKNFGIWYGYIVFTFGVKTFNGVLLGDPGVPLGVLAFGVPLPAGVACFGVKIVDFGDFMGDVWKTNLYHLT